MVDLSIDQKIQYVAQLTNVKEVSLLGVANLQYWQEWLHPYGLSPKPKDGFAQILVICSKSR
jgi:hypothetical protein